jgi:hypothetical protein
MGIPAANSTGTSLRPETRPAHMRIPSADSIRSPRLAHAIRSWLRLRTLLQMCDSGRRERHFSTGGLRPPLLSPVQRASAGRKTIFVMHNRTFTRAANASPPRFGRYVYADTRAIARKTAGSMWADRRCHRVQRYHGGLTPPALGCATFVRCEKRHSGCTNARSQERRA